VFVVWVTSRHASFAGVLALWIHSIADLTKLYAERLESIDEGLLEAISATGASRLQVLRYGVVPQIINPYISFTLYRFDINVRMATVVGLVGAGGIGQRLIAYLAGQRYPSAGTVMLLIVVAVWAIDYLSSRLRAKLR
jgi:phosphonate transport system permease protein